MWNDLGALSKCPITFKSKSKYKLTRNRKLNLRKTQILEIKEHKDKERISRKRISFALYLYRLGYKRQKVYQPLKNKMQSSYSIEGAWNEKSSMHGPKLEKYVTWILSKHKRKQSKLITSRRTQIQKLPQLRENQNQFGRDRWKTCHVIYQKHSQKAGMIQVIHWCFDVTDKH